MATKHYSAEDLQRIPLQGLRFENLSAAPSSPNTGDAYYDSVTGFFMVYIATYGWVKGSAAQLVNADIAAGAAIALTKLATDPLARANHTGTQLASTISNFDTQVRTSRLDQMAAPTSALSVGGQRITSLADPTGSTDAATYQWVNSQIDARVNGQDWKASVRVATSTNTTLAAPGSTVDGVTMVAGDRVLLLGQSTGSQNGIYVWTGAAVAMTRASDADTSAEVTTGMTVPVSEGTHLDAIYLLTTNDAITLDTTALTFTQIAGAGAYVAGTGLTLTGNSFALTSPVTVALGGTNASTASGARTSLSAALKGFASDVSALTAGVPLAIAHGLATDDIVPFVREISTGNKVDIDTKVDSTNITLTSAIAVSASVLRVTAATAV